MSTVSLSVFLCWDEPTHLLPFYGGCFGQLQYQQGDDGICKPVLVVRSYSQVAERLPDRSRLYLVNPFQLLNNPDAMRLYRHAKLAGFNVGFVP